MERTRTEREPKGSHLLLLSETRTHDQRLPTASSAKAMATTPKFKPRMTNRDG
jgi:hypothetical protein